MATINREEILKNLPEEGDDPEFDERLERATSTITASSLKVNSDDVRLAVAFMLASERGLSIEDAYKPKVETPPEPEIVKEVKVSFDNLLKAAEGKTTDYFWEPKPVTAFMNLFIDLSRRGLSKGAALAIGPSGCGKTEGYTRKFIEASIDHLVVHVATITDPEKWLGHKEIDEDGTRFVLSDLMNHVQKPGATIFDEINRAHPAILNVIFSLLDGQRRVQVPELQGERGEPFYIYVHPEHIFVATANIGGGYDGTYKMDVALLERFPYRIPRDFPPAAEEIKVLMNRTGITKEDAEKLVWVAGKARTAWKAEKLSRPISTRTVIHWAVLVSAGMPISQAAEFSVLGQYRDESDSSEDAVQIRAYIEGKGDKK